MLKNIDLIIYDLDGVLIDSSEAICETFNTVLDEIGEEKYPTNKIREMIGEPLVDMFRTVLPRSKKHLVEHCFDRYVEIFKETAPKSTKLLPGVRETLSFFKANDIKQSLATTKRSDVAGNLLEKLKIKAYFDLILGVNDVKKPKPSPEIIYLTLQKLNVNYKNSVFVEDTTIGLEAGKRAGIYTVAITTGTHPKEKLVNLDPDFIIDCICKLINIVII